MLPRTVGIAAPPGPAGATPTGRGPPGPAGAPPTGTAVPGAGVTGRTAGFPAMGGGTTVPGRAPPAAGATGIRPPPGGWSGLTVRPVRPASPMSPASTGVGDAPRGRCCGTADTAGL